MTNLSNVRDDVEKLMRLAGVQWDELQYISPSNVRLLKNHGMLWLFQAYLKRPKTTLERHAYIGTPHDIQEGDDILTPFGQWIRRQIMRLGAIKPSPWLIRPKT